MNPDQHPLMIEAARLLQQVSDETGKLVAIQTSEVEGERYTHFTIGTSRVVEWTCHQEMAA